MRKKFLIVALSFIFSVNICHSTEYKFEKDIRKQYKATIEDVILNHCEENIPKLDNKIAGVENIYNSFVKDKNNMKQNYDFVNCLNNVIADLQTSEFNLYFKLLNKTNEFLETQISLPGTDDESILYEAVIPYLKKNRINRKILMDFLYNTNEKYKYVKQVRDEIQEYSIAYEKQKSENFYNNYVEPKLNKAKPIDIYDDYTWRVTGFSVNEIYLSLPRIIQIFQESFLADVSTSYYDTGLKTILIKDKASYKLDSDDRFELPLALKFTGQYYSYRTIRGDKKTVPIFRLATYNEIKQKFGKAPTIGEPFYFAGKVDYNILFEEQIRKIYNRPIRLVNMTYKFAPFNTFRIWKEN